MHISLSAILLTAATLLSSTTASSPLEKRAYYTRSYLSSVARYRTYAYVAPNCIDPSTGAFCDFNCDSRDRSAPGLEFPPDASKGETEPTSVTLCMFFVLDERCADDGGEEAKCPKNRDEIITVVSKKTGWSRTEADRRLKQIEALSGGDPPLPEPPVRATRTITGLQARATHV